VSAHAAPAIHALLLDIEGTTTPLAFVSEVLFPYARRHLRQHLARHATTDLSYPALLDALRDEHATDTRTGESPPLWSDETVEARLASVASYCEWLMDRDRKSTSLKSLQGDIWATGYRQGELAGQVFDDVPRAFARWHDAELPIAIFSSGSVLAQQLLFRHSTAGNLSRFVNYYFDTTTGAKGDAASYERIATALSVLAASVLFVSDVTRELDAARRAGMQTRLSLRPGNPPVSAHDHISIHSLDEIDA
jgi:enolase-phosphatase E1